MSDKTNQKAAGQVRVPVNAPAEVQQAFRDINAILERAFGSRNVNWHGRRIIGAGDAVDDQDYVTLRDLKKFTGRTQGTPAIGVGGARTGSGSGSGGGATGLDVALADLSAIVEDYAAANPSQLANSCLASGGTWDFMDGVVAALMAADSRVGWCGQRGDPTDAAEDAICYWGRESLPPIAGEPGNYVVDIIGGHCGASPVPNWNSVNPAGAVWLPVRP